MFSLLQQYISLYIEFYYYIFTRKIVDNCSSQEGPHSLSVWDSHRVKPQTLFHGSIPDSAFAVLQGPAFILFFHLWRSSFLNLQRVPVTCVLLFCQRPGKRFLLSTLSFCLRLEPSLCRLLHYPSSARSAASVQWNCQAWSISLNSLDSPSPLLFCHSQNTCSAHRLLSVYRKCSLICPHSRFNVICTLTL